MSSNRKYESYYSKYDNAFFDSRWAEAEEIKASLTKVDFSSKSLRSAGVPYISDGKIVYVDTSDSHALVIGCSGSKKSRNFAFPQTLMLIKAGESIVISDFKGENFDLTSGFALANGYNVLVLNLRDPLHSHRWNPFYEPWRLLHEEHNIDSSREMINDFIHDFFISNSRSNFEPYWEDMAATMAMGLCSLLLTCADADEATIRSLIYLRNTGLNMDADGFLVDIAYELPHESYTYANLNAVFTTTERTRTCIVSTFDSKLRLFTSQPNITELFSGQDFDIRKFGEEKTILYIIAPDEKTTYSKLITNFIHQAYSILISHATAQPTRQLKKRVNFILDEFAQLPYINDFPSAISAARSRNIRFTLFIQSLHQLTSTYGENAETILGNTGNTIFLNSRELPLLNRMAELCGYNQDGHYLISPSRLQRLKNKEKGEALILLGSCYPFISNLADISDYDYDPNMYPPVDIPKRDEPSPLFEVSKLNDRLNWLCDPECKFEVQDTGKEDDYDNDDAEDYDEESLEAELERKFDELFGKIGNNDCDD